MTRETWFPDRGAAAWAPIQTMFDTRRAPNGEPDPAPLTFTITPSNAQQLTEAADLLHASGSGGSASEGEMRARRARHLMLLRASRDEIGETLSHAETVRPILGPSWLPHRLPETAPASQVSKKSRAATHPAFCRWVAWAVDIGQQPVTQLASRWYPPGNYTRNAGRNRVETALCAGRELHHRAGVLPWSGVAISDCRRGGKFPSEWWSAEAVRAALSEWQRDSILHPSEPHPQDPKRAEQLRELNALAKLPWSRRSELANALAPWTRPALATAASDS